MSKKRGLFSAGAIVASLALVGGLSACSAGDDGGGGDGDLKKSYTVATDTSFVPFEFKDKGSYVGFDIDLIKAIGKEAGFKVKLKTTNFDGIIPGLQTGTFDMAIAGISITDERAKKIDYSDPYYKSGLRIGVPVDNKDIKGIKDLEGKNVATRLGSTSAAYIKKNIAGATPKEFEQLDQAYLSVAGGSTDAVLYDAPNVAYYIKTKGKDSLKMVGDLYQAENYGIAIAKGQDSLVKAVNKSLKSLKKDGSYNKIYKKWFGEEPKD